MYIDGDDDEDVPELSVQLVTREGPNDEEFTEAALPQPAPDPVEEVLDDPGTSEQTLDAPMLADATPMLEADSRGRADRRIGGVRRAHARGGRGRDYHGRVDGAGSG